MLESDLVIRLAEPADAPVLADLAARTFFETYAAQNTAEDMAAYLASSFGEAQQGGQIADPDVRSLLAEVAGEAAGYVQLRRGEPPPCVQGAHAIEVWRFYVDRRWIGRGLAQRLMAAAREEARALGGQTLWLGVWERNPRAIAFYCKCGFVPVGEHLFQFGADAQTDLVMTSPLVT
jgi:diamine N-acetyltransferase